MTLLLDGRESVSPGAHRRELGTVRTLWLLAVGLVVRPVGRHRGAFPSPYAPEGR